MGGRSGAQEFLGDFTGSGSEPGAVGGAGAGGKEVTHLQTTPGVFLVEGLLHLSSIRVTEWLGPQQLG